MLFNTVSFENHVKITDALLNCIPGLSLLNSVVQALYKSAYKADSLNPVVPGLKTSIKIHVLSKDNVRLFCDAIPVFGNALALIRLVLSILSGFDDDLKEAVIVNNTEVVRLCLGNNPLNEPNRASDIFCTAAAHSNNATFRQILDHRNDWSAKTLMQGLNCSGNAPSSCLYSNHLANANAILDFWTASAKVLDDGALQDASSAFKNFLKGYCPVGGSSVDLTERVFKILPDSISFNRVQAILLKHSCAQYDHLGTGRETNVLSRVHRKALIQKSTKPSLEQLKTYYDSVLSQRLHIRASHPSSNTMIHLDTLDTFLDRAQLEPDKLGEFIIKIAGSTEYDFALDLFKKYKEQLTPEARISVLRTINDSDFFKLDVNANQFKLLYFLNNELKNSINLHINKCNLYCVNQRSELDSIEEGSTGYEKIQTQQAGLQQPQLIVNKLQKLLERAKLVDEQLLRLCQTRS